jgi:hypothetical protein
MEAAGPDGRPKKVKVTIWDTGNTFFYTRLCNEIGRTNVIFVNF